MSTDQPIFCDMTDAVDTPADRRAEYRELFAQGHLRSERSATGVRHTFRRGPGVVEHLQDLTARERSCCGFLDLAVSVEGDRVHWDIDTDAGSIAETVVEDFLRLPETLRDDTDVLSVPLSVVVRGRTG